MLNSHHTPTESCKTWNPENASEKSPFEPRQITRRGQAVCKPSKPRSMPAGPGARHAAGLKDLEVGQRLGANPKGPQGPPPQLARSTTKAPFGGLVASGSHPPFRCSVQSGQGGFERSSSPRIHACIREGKLPRTCSFVDICLHLQRMDGRWLWSFGLHPIGFVSFVGKDSFGDFKGRQKETSHFAGPPYFKTRPFFFATGSKRSAPEPKWPSHARP